jgi:hypothetical protein
MCPHPTPVNWESIVLHSRNKISFHPQVKRWRDTYSPLHLGKKTDLVSKTVLFGITDDEYVQKPSNPKCKTPSAEPFKHYFKTIVTVFFFTSVIQSKSVTRMQ